MRLAAVIALATALFVVGAAVERESSPPQIESATEGGEHHAEATTAETERVARIDVESPGPVIAAAVLSLALAAAVVRRPRARTLLAAIALIMLAFGLADIREVLHQIDENRTGLALLAAAVAALHLAASGLSARRLAPAAA